MTGFHANSIAECERFLTEKTYIISSENDTDYLGRGMYFWEHKSSAEWWQKKKKDVSNSMIVSAELSLKNALDLTDDDICDKMNKMIAYIDKSIIRKIGRERNSKSKDAMGVILDSLFEAFSAQMSKFDIVKAVKHYDGKKEADFLASSPFTTKSVLILCAKTAAPIGAREKVYE